MEFMSVPDTYYNQLRENLKHSKVKISEDLDVLQVRTNIRYELIWRTGMVRTSCLDKGIIMCVCVCVWGWV